MKYKRPSAQASIDSWVNIWLGCLDCSFYEPHSKPSTIKAEDKNKKYQAGTVKRLGSSLHQHRCGHGYRLREAYYISPTIIEAAGLSDAKWASGTLLGCSPEERRSEAIKFYLRKT